MNAATTDATAEREPQVTVHVTDFGQLPDGRTARLFTLRNASGVEARITEYGAAVVSLLAPDRDGNLLDVVHGFDTLDRYLAGEALDEADWQADWTTAMAMIRP